MNRWGLGYGVFLDPVLMATKLSMNETSTIYRYLWTPKPWKMKVLGPQYIGEITPKNEGFGFPWYLYSGNPRFPTFYDLFFIHICSKKVGPEPNRFSMEGYRGSYKKGCNRNYILIRPFIGVVITPFITGRGRLVFRNIMFMFQRFDTLTCSNLTKKKRRML